MTDKGESREDLKLPDGELGQKIREEFTKEDNTVIVSRYANLLISFELIVGIL